MSLPSPETIVRNLIELQRKIRDVVIASHARSDNADVSHASSADTIYKIDTDVEPIIVDYCRHWSKSLPMVVISEGLEDEEGREGPRAFPDGSKPEEAVVRMIFDPIDGTRGIMYDKRPAWSLAGVAPNRGEATRLSDIEVAVMTELPTSKMGMADVLSAIRGRGAVCRRDDLRSGGGTSFVPRPSRVEKIDHGFATVANFFPGTKVMASELLERIVETLVGRADITRATVFDDQYISTGGQFYELIVGHDRFVADLRPLFYARGKHAQSNGLCVHPYDCCTALVATEAGVILTDGLGNPLDGPLDCTSDIHWAGYANRALADQIGPILRDYFGR